MLEKTYQLELNSPPAMPRSEYRAMVEQEWASLLESDPTERAVQHFLEQHPAMVPGAFGMAMSSGHAPFPGALISQPSLYGYWSRKPDFLWISKSSLHLNPIFIEIEAPTKKLFTAQGQPSADFTQARTQLGQWKAWLSMPGNLDSFLRDYGVTFPNLKVEPHYVLVYGRRREMEGNPQLSRLRAELMGPNEHLMSYDRLFFEPKAEDLPSVRHTTRGYKVLHLPASYALGPCMFDYDTPLLGRLEAASKNPFISDERKEFMRHRIPYWEAWHQSRHGISSMGDQE